MVHLFTISSCLVFVLWKSQRGIFVTASKVWFSKESDMYPFKVDVTAANLTRAHTEAWYLCRLCCGSVPHSYVSLL